MDSNKNTVKSETINSLSEMNIPLNLLKFRRVCVQSDKLVCIRGDSRISIVDLRWKNVANLKSSVDSIIINPEQKILGLQSDKNLQVFDLSKKLKLKSIVFPHEILFWCWVNERVIAIVTEESVFHWELFSDKEPFKVFAREPFERKLQVVSYKSSENKDWLILNGMAQGENGNAVGVLQLYSDPRKRSQIFNNSFAGCFAKVLLEGRNRECSLFCFVTKTDGNSAKVSMVEIAALKQKSFRMTTTIEYDSHLDFPVALLDDEDNRMLWLITKMGLLFVIDIQSGKCVVRNTTKGHSFFTAVKKGSSGVVAVGQNGMVTTFNINGENLVAHLREQGDVALCAQLSVRLNLPADEKLYIAHLNKMVESKNIEEAVRIAIKAPNNLLRTKETLNKLFTIDYPQGSNAPLSQYFNGILREGKLNNYESLKFVELMRNSSKDSSGYKQMEEYIRQEKFTFSEELGNLFLPQSPKYACSIFLRTNSVPKVIDCFILLGQFDQAVQYAKKKNCEINYLDLLKRMYDMDSEKAKDLALSLVKDKKVSLEDATDVFMMPQDFKTTTSFLLDCFKFRGDLADDADQQTLLLSINLENAPQVAEAILDSSEYELTHYNKNEIARLCESKNLYSKALENFEELSDIKRCLETGLSNDGLSQEFAVKFFGEITVEEGLECLSHLLQKDKDTYLDLVVNIAIEYRNQMTEESLISLLEDQDAPKGLFRFLGTIVNTSKNPKVVLKYAQAAAKSEKMEELRRLCAKNDVFDPEEMKNFLFEQDFSDPRPLIFVCNRFGFVREMTEYLYSREMFEFIKIYLHKMNCKAAPKVFEELADLGASEDQLKVLLSGINPNNLGTEFDVLINGALESERLPLFLAWLESHASKGSKMVGLHNALGKIYVIQNKSPEKFLEKNEYYDSKVLGAFCESRDLKLALKAYARTKNSEQEILRVAQAGGFYSELAHLLVERQDEKFWEKALEKKDEHRPALVSQVVKELERSNNPEEVSVAVKAFIAADLPKDLIELLEQLVLGGDRENAFQTNRNLQNLLILTAIKADSKRVKGYINRLTDYDGPEIAKIAVSNDYKLYDEAFEIYKKFEEHEKAINILLADLDEIDKAKKYAEKIDRNEIWEVLGNFQLESGNLEEAVDSFVKGKCTKHTKSLSYEVESNDKNWDALVKYLEMVSSNSKDPEVDKKLLFAYAKSGDLASFKKFIQSKKWGKIDQVGDNCMRADMYDAAHIIYEHTQNHNRLALCYVNLRDLEKAVTAAKKANSTKTWKAVCYACVDDKEFELGEECVLRVSGQIDQLRDIIKHYEYSGNFKEAVKAVEKCLGHERAQSGVFTLLGELFCKYSPDKLMSHLSSYSEKINLHSLIKICLEFQKWKEAVFLYKENLQFEKAIDMTIEHSPSCFDPADFLAMASEVKRSDLLMKMIDFCETMHPMCLNELLIEIKTKVDEMAILKMFKIKKMIPLIFEYLLKVQVRNKKLINDAINQHFIEEENLEGLKKSITRYNCFDAESLAIQLAEHRLKKFRKLAAFLMNKSQKYDKALVMLQKEGAFEDMIETVKLSKDRLRAEELVRFFVKIKNRTHLAIALYECRALLQPHVLIEVAWRFGMSDLTMPFIVQAVSDFEKKVEKLEKENEERKQKEEQSANKGGSKMGKNRVLAIMSRQSQNGSASYKISKSDDVLA